MALIKLKPTSPGTRFVVKVDKSHLWKGGPYEPLTTTQAKTGGRNSFGRITTRHKGGGSRQKFRIIDMKRDKDGVKGVVERIEHDPNRTGHIALVKYVDGERRFILSPKGVVMKFARVPIRRSSRAMRCSCVTSPSVQPCTTSS
jgi:large subunit ribosomal protein L2